MQKKILLVDDDALFQKAIKAYLEQNSYSVCSALSAAELMENLGEFNPDTILLDLRLPDGDGLSLIPKIREITDAPVIVVSSNDDSIDKVVGLEMGADDYICKPFESRELLARIKANARRYAGASRTAAKAPPQDSAGTKRRQVGFDGWVLDQDRMEVFDADDNPAGLTSSEFALLEALVLEPNRVKSREQLFEALRQDDYSSFDRAIDIQITRIRKKINDNAQSPRYIKTVRGVGYMFIHTTHKPG